MSDSSAVNSYVPSTLKSLANSSQVLSVKESTIGLTNRSQSEAMPNTCLDKDHDLVQYPPDIISTTIERKHSNSFWNFSSQPMNNNDIEGHVLKTHTRRKSKSKPNLHRSKSDLRSHRENNFPSCNSRCSDDMSVISVTSEVDSIMAFNPKEEEDDDDNDDEFRCVAVQCDELRTLNEYVQVNISDNGPVFDLKRENANLKGRLESLNFVVEEMSKERSSIQTKMHSFEKEMRTKSNDYDELLSAKQRLLLENEDLKSGLAKWETIVADYQEVIESKITEVNSLKEDINCVENENEQLKIISEQFKADVEKKENELKQLTSTVADKELELENISKKVVRLQNDIKYLNTEIDSKCEQRDHYLNEVTKLQSRLTEIQQKMITEQNEALSVKAELDKVHSENFALKQDLIKLKQKAYEEKKILMKNLEGIEADLLERGTTSQSLSTLTDGNRVSKEEHLSFNESEALKKEIDGLKSLNSCLTHDKQVLTNRVESLQKSLSDREFELSSEKCRVNEVETKLKGMKSELKTLRDFNELLRKDKVSCEEKLALALRDNKLLESGTRLLKDNVEKHERSVKQMRGELIAKEKKLEISEKEKFKFENTVSVKDNEIKSLKDLIERSMQERSNNNFYEMQLKKNELEKTIESLSKELKSSSVRFEHEQSLLKEDVEKLQQKVKTVESENCSLRNELAVTRDEKTKLENALSEVQNEKEYFKNLSRNFDTQAVVTGKNDEELSHLKLDKDKVRLLQSNFKLVLRKYKETKQALRTLEARLDGHHEKQTRNTETQTEANAFEDLTKSLNEAGNEIEGLKSLIQEKQRIIDESETIILNFEHEKGKITNSEDTSLKQQISSLESMIFSRNAEVSELNSSLRETEQKHKEELLKLNKKIESLQEELKKERALLKDHRSCVVLEKRENSQLKRELSSMKKALTESSQIADRRKQELTQLESKLEEQKNSETKLRNEIEHLSILLQKAKSDCEALKSDSQQSQRRDNTLMQEVMNLSLSLKEKTQQIQGLKLDIEVIQKRHESEKMLLAEKVEKMQSELDSVKSELTATRKEKFSYQSKVGDLRAALKSTIEQNKKLSAKAECNEANQEANNDFLNGIVGHNHMSGDGKKPLIDLQSCVESLKLEMESLQQQMKEYEE